MKDLERACAGSWLTPRHRTAAGRRVAGGQGPDPAGLASRGAQGPTEAPAAQPPPVERWIMRAAKAASSQSRPERRLCAGPDPRWAKPAHPHAGGEFTRACVAILCLLAEGATTDAPSPRTVTRYLLVEAAGHAAELAGGGLRDDFRTEVGSSWPEGSDTTRGPVISTCDPSGLSRKVRCWSRLNLDQRLGISVRQYQFGSYFVQIMKSPNNSIYKTVLLFIDSSGLIEGLDQRKNFTSAAFP